MVNGVIFALLEHRSPKLRIRLLIRNTIKSDTTNIREFVFVLSLIFSLGDLCFGGGQSG